MLTVAPLSVLVLGILGLAVVLASVARMVVLEHRMHQTPFFVDPPQERPRVAA